MKIVTGYRYANLLSFDVAAGAVCSALFFARLLKSHIQVITLIVLFLVVWMIYTVDHLLDAQRLPYPASSERHRFHQRHKRPLLVVLILAFVVTLVLVGFLDTRILKHGLYLGTVVMVYLVLHRALAWTKELWIAVLYTAGVLLPLGTTSPPLPPWPWVIITQFGLVAFLNLLVFSWFDYDNDKREGSFSFVTITGKLLATRGIVAIAAVVLILSLFTEDGLASAILVVMVLAHLIMFLKPEYFTKNDLYRLIGDAVFFLPLLYLLIE
jgi:hypothetical protein